MVKQQQANWLSGSGSKIDSSKYYLKINDLKFLNHELIKNITLKRYTPVRRGTFPG